MKFTIILSLFLLVCKPFAAEAQPYMVNKSQHRFAQTYLGMNTQFIPSSGNLVANNSAYTFPDMYSPRFTIGGMHFWGKLDFNINIPLGTIGDFKLNDRTDMYFYSGADLSARFYPLRMQYGKIRPYAGISANEMIFRLNDKEEGKRSDLFITTSVLGGISYAQHGWQVNAEWMWLPDNKRDFFSSRTDKNSLELPKSYFSLGLVRYFEGTLREEKDMMSGRIQKLESKFRSEGKLNSFSISAAPSGSYFLLAPKLNDPVRQSLPRHKVSFVWDFGLGYLFHDAGIHAGFSYRDYTSVTESYEFEHHIRRRSIALEVFKFFGDYNGFVPFVGPSISLENWATGEFEGDDQLGKTRRKQMISPGIIFGWDILASPLETWVLRTNLRYYPFQEIKGTDGKTSRVDQFEFNFIQLVIYPNRLLHFPKVKGRI